MNSKSGLVFIVLGAEAVIILLGCIFLGQKVDEALNTQGKALIFMVILGLIGWFVHLAVLLHQYAQKTKAKKRHNKN